MDLIPGEKPRETEVSRRGIGYSVANGNSIRNKGELTLRGTAENGVKLNVISQASDVTQPLGAAREMIKAGNRIVLDEEESYIQNKRTQKKIPMKRDNGMFIVTMKIQKGNKRYEGQQYAVLGTEDSPSFLGQVMGKR